jgi:hypothetical protein
MSDIRDGMARERVIESGATLQAKTPPGSEITLEDDGTATFSFGEEEESPDGDDHWANLAETTEESRLSQIATDLLDAIEVDKQSRKERDNQYAEGIRRTGLGNDAPGGAPFNGASRAVHPMLLEAVVDYAGRVAEELLPSSGPVKPFLIGQPTNQKVERGERVARFMNYQLTQVMESFADEVEVGLSQQGLAGGFYLKPVVVNGKPDVVVRHIDQVHRPWGNGNFYSQPRITDEMTVSKWEFQENVKSGLWRDVLNPATSSDNISTTQAEQANDRAIGRTQPEDNIDEERIVFETSTMLSLDGEEDSKPYIVTIDEQTRRVLSIYRNWDEGDLNLERLDFLIEFPFWPWRGGYPIGLAHMIGSLSGATSGALRAMLDAALLSTMQTGVKLKGGATAGGQNVRPQVGSTTEMQGTLAMDDIRKTYMPLEFPPPSEVLFKLMGFLVDTGRGVIRTTFDEFNKMNGETPVGTANLMVEQGLKSYGAIFRRQHRAMGRFLKMLWRINGKIVQNEQIVDQFGELLVTKEDFTGPMCVQPVSDPRIFSDAQRQAQAMYMSGRIQALAEAGPMIYKVTKVEAFGLKQMKVPDPEQFLNMPPEPQQLDAASENVASAMGMPLKAFPGQDHEAHIAQHGAFLSSPLFGSNPAMAMKCVPIIVGHLTEHLALWYADAMLLATDAVLQKTFNDPRITLQSLKTVKGLEAELDRLMAELTPDVLQHAQETLGPVMQVIGQAQELMKKLSPPQPMDPSIVAQQDVQRQQQKDQADVQLKAKDQDTKAQERQLSLQLKARGDEQDRQQAAQEHAADVHLKTRDQDIRAEEGRRRDAISAENVDVSRERNDVTRETTEMNNQTQLEITDRDNETALEIADEKIKHGGSTNISDGKGLSK